MPTQKDFKRLVRARMKKTGESYTSARARLLQHGTSRRPAAAHVAATTPVAATAPLAADYARLAGMSDAAIKAKTGCTWKRWAQALDTHGAQRMPHRDIAELVRRQFEVTDWWAQTVAVGYERIRGLREIGQRRGGYEATKSKTFPVPVDRLYRAFADPRQRRRWLSGAELKVRTTARGRSMRWTWGDGTLLHLDFVRKGEGRSQVTVQHAKLPDRRARERTKAYWTERLEALAALLGR